MVSKINIQKRNRWIVSGIVCTIIIVALATTIFFTSIIEEIFKLRPGLNTIDETSLEVHFVDVGQGDAILIRFPNEETMLVDAGPSRSFDYLENYINNVFFKNGEEKSFDYVLLTHGDADHSGGMLDILKKYPVELFYRPAITTEQQGTQTYENVLDKLISLQASGETSVVTSIAGITIKNGDDNIIEFLSPIESYYQDSNDYSPILILNYCGEKIMLTGDAGSGIEDNILEEFTSSSRLDELDVDVLKVSHHGSSNASSLSFLEAVKPEYAVISVALQNSYNHPSDITISNLIETGTDEIYKTSKKGNIICYINEGEEIDFLFVQNADSYIYVDWYIIVIVLIFCTIITFFILNIKHGKPNINKRKKGKIS